MRRNGSALSECITRAGSAQTKKAVPGRALSMGQHCPGKQVPTRDSMSPPFLQPGLAIRQTLSNGMRNSGCRFLTVTKWVCILPPSTLTPKTTWPLGTEESKRREFYNCWICLVSMQGLGFIVWFSFSSFVYGSHFCDKEWSVAPRVTRRPREPFLETHN